MEKGRSRGLRILVAGVALATMAGCANGITAGSEIEQGPVGIGRSINELRGTPCACTEIPMEIPSHMKV